MFKMLAGREDSMKAIEELHTWTDYLTILNSEGKDARDPTYLMQAFDMTRSVAESVITIWLANYQKGAG